MNTSSDITSFLPGFASIQYPCPTSPAIYPDGTCPEYWVRTSDEQTLDKYGHPIGFRHQLMRGKKTVRYHKGTGADTLRTLRAQATYFNSLLAANTVTALPQAFLTQGMQVPVPTTILQYGIPGGRRTPDACTA